MIREAIDALVEGQSLTMDEAAASMNEIMKGDATPAQFGAYVTALRLKGETVQEIAGMARVMREKAHMCRCLASWWTQPARVETDPAVLISRQPQRWLRRGLG